jgi:hypothetical protein
VRLTYSRALETLNADKAVHVPGGACQASLYRDDGSRLIYWGFHYANHFLALPDIASGGLRWCSSDPDIC